MTDTTDTTTDTTEPDGPFRVVIDRDKCVGHGRCYSLAPEVYVDDEEGFSELADGDTPATPELRDKARLGAVTCPEGAISLVPL
ncbi:ferredoxin [Nocardioides marmoribigeumensis]|uniref:Ferredoxin n=1 Tax=Nocardioides marmoribigeumensis TaxID=433649 RepID=A0ABU2BXX3_9ACTN|nr:ferredoxin [Nocardioides marmoribigeumensis]MDR7363263.1 ferredoxin [Nocardioides marmoribigeumensis]